MMVKVISLESVPFLIVFVMYFIYVTSGPSLLIESTDSMVWSNFHQLRCNTEVHRCGVQSLQDQFQQIHCQESQLVLQILMDRIMKKMLENQAKEEKRYEVVLNDWQAWQHR